MRCITGRISTRIEKEISSGKNKESANEKGRGAKSDNNTDNLIRIALKKGRKG